MPRLRLALVIGSCAALVVAFYQPGRVRPSDFAQIWFAARAWMWGLDPYAVVGPGQAFDWPFPLLYPMTAVLVAVPFSLFPIWLADPLFAGLGAGLFAFAVTKDRLDDPRLLACLSSAGVVAMQTAQWSPLLAAGALVPLLTPLWACKPTLGLALLAAYPSKRAVIGMAGLTLLSLLAWPTWPQEWLAALPSATHMTAPVMRPGGFLVLLALYRWRLPEARLLVAWSCLPQTPVLYEAVPLFLLVKTWHEGIALTALTFLSGLTVRVCAPYQSYEAWMNAGGLAMLWLIYLPCTIVVLRRTHVQSMATNPDRDPAADAGLSVVAYGSARTTARERHRAVSVLSSDVNR